MRGVAFLLLTLAPVGGAAAQQRVVSPAPEAVSVTVYRNSGRSLDDKLNLDWLGGYALVSETRTVELPAGTSDIRFEGVADTLIPASVIISGLPRQPDEKNYDARLLSPGALVDAHLGRQVHVRRTHRKTGKITETEAIIRSGPNGIVLQTPAGIEALSCTGMAETLIYHDVPEGLSDKPTLSIRASVSEPVRATVRLSYLATQFDWQANYVASLAPDGQTLDLFAWLTLANGNDTSFPSAQTQAVAGEPNREDGSDDVGVATVSPEVRLECWPAGTTSDVGEGPLPPAPPPEAERDEMDIVVTGSRVPEAKMMSASPVAMVAQQEELGDLKLYRIPEPVTVAANAQKQVALLVKDRVPYERVYALEPSALNEVPDPRPVAIKLRMKNLKQRGLGLPLPSGTVAVFETVRGRPMMVGEPGLADTAVGEDVELEVGASPDVTYIQTLVSAEKGDGNGEGPRRYRIEVANARAQPATVEVELKLFGNQSLVKPSRRLGIKNGRSFWRAVVPANSRAALAYTIERMRTKKD